MARVIIPANSWVDVKDLLGLTDDDFYVMSNEGNSILQVVTTQDAGVEPAGDPNLLGVKQNNLGALSWLEHSSASGKGIWVYSYNISGQMEVQI